MAIRYSDGWGLYRWHGIEVPGWVIESPEKINPELIQSEKNAEVRRIMISRYGWDKMLSVMNAKLIDRHYNPTIGELWRWTEPDGIQVQIIRAQNGTPNSSGEYEWYTLRVPLEVNNAIDACKWTYPNLRGISREDYLILNGERA